MCAALLKTSPVLLAVSFSAVLSSCCAPPAPQPGKFFDRGDPTSTLKGFVYAVDTYQWDYAYQSLTKADRKEIGPLKFRVAIFLKDPAWHAVSVFDIISNSLERRTRPQMPGDGRAYIRVTSKVRDSKGLLLFFVATLSFLEEEGEWRIDFIDTLRSFSDDSPETKDVTSAVLGQNS